VLLHQTDGNGLCGWLPFMGTYADPELSFLAFDLCGYGESRCTKVATRDFSDADQTDAVALAVEYARSEMHARRVVVVGASMGGGVALMSAATLPDLDAAVDLSGPADWPGTEVVRGGRALLVPVFLSTAEEEGEAEVSAAERTARNAPRGSTFALAERGHGYELLNDPDGHPLPLGGHVLRWIEASTSSPVEAADVRTPVRGDRRRADGAPRPSSRRP
jgi:pimeloyl-ACP methyl ester carboxylesterase